MRTPAAIPSERDVPFERVSETVGRVAIPLPFFSVPVNVWIVLAERPLLVDAGPRTDVARARVEAGLAAMGTRPEDVSHVFVTHHHVDHSGLLEEWLARSGAATALVHEDDLDAALDVSLAIDRSVARYREVVRRWGFAPDDAEKVVEQTRGFARFGGRAPRERARAVLGERSPLGVPGASLVAIHVPGHTEGQALLWDEGAGVLFAGDMLLERVTPNPNVYVPPYRGRTTGLAHMITSFEALRELPRDTLVYPGHGAPFRGIHARIDELLLHHSERASAVLVALEGGPRTILEVARSLWSELSPLHLVLAAREVHGHLDLLLDQGKVAREDDGPAWRFRRLA